MRPIPPFPGKNYRLTGRVLFRDRCRDVACCGIINWISTLEISLAIGSVNKHWIEQVGQYPGGFLELEFRLGPKGRGNYTRIQ